VIDLLEPLNNDGFVIFIIDPNAKENKEKTLKLFKSIETERKDVLQKPKATFFLLPQFFTSDYDATCKNWNPKATKKYYQKTSLQFLQMDIKFCFRVIIERIKLETKTGTENVPLESKLPKISSYF